MFFDLDKISQGKEFALKFIDSLPLKSLEKIHPVIIELLEHIEIKIGEKNEKIQKSRGA